VDTRKRGRRPTLSTRKAQETLTIKERIVCPPLSYNAHIFSNHPLTSISAETYWDFLVLVCNSHSVINKIHVVAEEGIARVLRDDTERNEYHKSATVALGADEICVTARLLVEELQTQGLLDLEKFKLDCCIVLITICVVLGKCRQCLLVTFFGHEPTWRLWNPCKS